MIKVKLRETLERHYERTGERLSHAELAELTGLSLHTIHSLASRSTYNTRLSVIDRLCVALECGLDEILEFEPESKLSPECSR